MMRNGKHIFSLPIVSCDYLPAIFAPAIALEHIMLGGSHGIIIA
jgi:hypothetical protein